MVNNKSNEIYRISHNGTWINRELYTIASIESHNDQSNDTGDEDYEIQGIFRYPSTGESAILTNEGQSIGTVESNSPLKSPKSPRKRQPIREVSRSFDSTNEVTAGTVTHSTLSPPLSRSYNHQTSQSLEKNWKDTRKTPNYPSSYGSSSQDTSHGSYTSQSKSYTSASSPSPSSDSQNTSFTSDASNTYISDTGPESLVANRNLERLPAGVLALERISRSHSDGDEFSYYSTKITKIYPQPLHNVDYVSSFDQASTNSDLSTLDGPFSKEAAMEIFFPSSKESPENSHTLGKSNATNRTDSISGEPRRQESGFDLDVSHATPNTVPTFSEKVAISIFTYLEGRSRPELFFVCLIAISSITLLVLTASLFSTM
jgi:hypothetical protein